MLWTGQATLKFACGGLMPEMKDAQTTNYRFRILLVNPLAQGACALIIVPQILWIMYN